MPPSDSARASEVAGKTYFCQGVYLGEHEMRILYIFYPESLWQDVLWTAVKPSLYLGLFGGLASVVLALGMAQRLSRAVLELELRTRQIAAGDFSPMSLPRRNDELRDLGKSVNDMAARLSHLQETVKQNERLRLSRPGERRTRSSGSQRRCRTGSPCNCTFAS